MTQVGASGIAGVAGRATSYMTGALFLFFPLFGIYAALVSQSNQYERNPWVAEYALRRANGHCQLCKKPAPSKKKDGSPYLEIHHIEWLSEGVKIRLRIRLPCVPIVIGRCMWIIVKRARKFSGTLILNQRRALNDSGFASIDKTRLACFGGHVAITAGS